MSVIIAYESPFYLFKARTTKNDRNDLLNIFVKYLIDTKQCTFGDLNDSSYKSSFILLYYKDLLFYFTFNVSDGNFDSFTRSRPKSIIRNLGNSVEFDFIFKIRTSLLVVTELLLLFIVTLD